ncbi:MAG: VOC family protein [Gemmataceae bacterium]|nr:VOC family protein [Gemmataceae bacterium]
MPRVIHFEIHCDDTARAIAFYEAAFGCAFQRYEGGPMEYWLVTTGPDSEPGINGGLMKLMGPPPGTGAALNAFACTVHVPDLEAALESCLGAGATLAVPRMPIPGVGWLAYVVDPEKNILGLMQHDPAAR